jgi:SusD/RagB-like outer membrane lipoprotein
MKNFIKTFLVIIVMFIAPSCDTTFEEINRSKNKPEVATVDVLLAGAIYAQLDNYGGRLEGIMEPFVQRLSGIFGSTSNMDQYILDNSNFTYFFTGFYTGPLNSYKDIIAQGTEEESWHYVGAAKVMTALALGKLTDMYGEIPWTEALNLDNSFPVYDTQESIYGEIDRLLNEAVTDLGKTSFRALSDGDFILNGNTDAWIASAHLLSARYANHLSKRDPLGSATTALAHIDAANAAGISSSTDLKMKYEGTSQSLNRWNILYNNNAMVAEKRFMDDLLANDDPRVDAYFSEIDGQGRFTGLKGKPIGTGSQPGFFSAVNPDSWYSAPNSDHMVATYFELLFIEAEAAFRSGDLPRAATAHNAAVREQIELVVTVPGDSRIEPYIAIFGNETDATITMEKIMTEKWKATFTMSEESWTDMRRHDFAYPAFVEIPRFADGTPVAAEFIRRILYPQDELDKNGDQVPANVSIFDRLWWDQ